MKLLIARRPMTAISILAFFGGLSLELLAQPVGTTEKARTPTDTERVLPAHPPLAIFAVPEKAEGIAGLDHHFPPALTDTAPHDVVTQHNDNHRTGAYLAETELSPGNVGPGRFGRLYTRNVAGSELAQILYVHGVNLPASRPPGTKNLFFVATQQNWVYAFDADDVNPDPNTPAIWKCQLAQPDSTTMHCGEQSGPVGITSTPVIDLKTGIMYVAARHSDANTYLHALHIATGANVRPAVKVSAEDPVSHVRFDTSCQRNRPGLLLLNGVVYLAFGCFTCDAGPYHGWVIGYRASDFHAEGVFCTSAKAQGAGIWQSGNGLAADPGGCIYFEAANDFHDSPAPLGDSFVRLHGTQGRLDLVGVFTPPNATILRDGPAAYPASYFRGDTDLGSSGPIILPGGKLLGGGKEGRFHVLDMAAMRFNPQHPADQNWIAFVNTWHNDSKQPLFTSPQGVARVTASQAAHHSGMVGASVYIPAEHYQDSELTGPNIHSGPIFWQRDSRFGYVYCLPEKDHVRAFRYDLQSRHVEEKPAFESSFRCPDGMPGGAISLSANGGKDGIVWASCPTEDGQWNLVNGHFLAFDASNLKLLYTDPEPVMYTKFCPPTVADGKVFRPTGADQIVVYGALHRRFDVAGLHDAKALYAAAKIPEDAPRLSIAQKYQNYGGGRGQLGQPIGGELNLNDPAGGKVQRFAGKRIIAQACQMAPNNSDADSEKSMGKLAQDGKMQVNLPIETAIYWSPSNGAHVVRGEFLACTLSSARRRANSAIPSPTSNASRESQFSWSSFRRAILRRRPAIQRRCIMRNSSCLPMLARARRKQHADAPTGGQFSMRAFRFEPTAGLLLLLISSQVPLTTQPPFQPFIFRRFKAKAVESAALASIRSNFQVVRRAGRGRVAGSRTREFSPGRRRGAGLWDWAFQNSPLPSPI